VKFAVPAPTKTTIYYQIISAIFTGPMIMIKPGKIFAILGRPTSKQDKLFTGKGQGFLSCPAVGCPCGLPLSPGAPLPISAGLGSLGFPAVNIWSSRIGMREILGKLTFRPNLCYYASCEKNWLREEDRLGDFIGQRASQNRFLTAVAKIGQ